MSVSAASGQLKQETVLIKTSSSRAIMLWLVLWWSAYGKMAIAQRLPDEISRLL